MNTNPPLEKEVNNFGASVLTASALQAASPIVLALQECDEELRDEAVCLFKQLRSNDLDDHSRIATTALLAEILFPNADHNGLPGLDLVEAEQIAPTVLPESKGKAAKEAMDEMDRQESFFAERLDRFLAEKGMTQSDLAEKIGVGQPAISMMLSRNCRPQKKTLHRIASALGVGLEDLWPNPKQ
jgi:DNA-binding phage protein